MGSVKNYLICYNIIQTIGWSYIFYLILKNAVATKGTFGNIYYDVAMPLQIFQTLAIMEILHSVFGFVRSAAFTTAIQVFSRVFLVWGVCYSVPQVRERTIGIPMMLFAWSITEIVRYSFYACSLIKFTPYILTWLRYTTFYVLYPIGVTGELLTIFASLPFAEGCHPYNLRLPNQYNISFNFQYFLIFMMLTYIPFFPQLYCYMISQRKKVLGQASSSETSKKEN